MAHAGQDYQVEGRQTAVPTEEDLLEDRPAAELRTAPPGTMRTLEDTPVREELRPVSHT